MVEKRYYNLLIFYPYKYTETYDMPESIFKVKNSCEQRQMYHDTRVKQIRASNSWASVVPTLVNQAQRCRL